MLPAAHSILTETCADLARWPAELIPHLAEVVTTPDAVDTVAIDGMGKRPLGMNPAAFAHFGRRVIRPGPGGRMLGGGFVVNGYCWNTDPTIGPLGLPKGRVIAYPDAWPWPMTDAMRKRDPLALLTADGSGVNCKFAAFTFPSAVAYVEHFERCIGQLDLGSEPSAYLRRSTIAHLVAWILHLVQDLCVPFHSSLMLLGGHSEFEGAQLEFLVRMLPTMKSDVKPDELVIRGTSFRAIAEGCAGSSYVAPSLLMDDMLHAERRAHRVAQSVSHAFFATLMLLTVARDRYLGGAA